MRIHPLMVPFLTPMKKIETNLGAYIAPVNHNKINTGIAVNIASTMMGRFAQEDDKDTSQLQEMGSDAGVVFGYSEKHVRTFLTFNTDSVIYVVWFVLTFFVLSFGFKR
jgi:hypothetical protein